MDALIKILVVEEEMIIGEKLSTQLTCLGYAVTAILATGEAAVAQVENNRPDLILLSIQLTGKLDGIETALAIQKIADIPIIFLTADSDDATFNRAKTSKPFAFISKPYRQVELQRAIELTITRITGKGLQLNKANDLQVEQPVLLDDRLFIRQRDKLLRIIVADILYIEADRNYSRVFTRSKDYLLCLTLKTIEEKLPPRIFIRIHRSFIVNFLHIDEVADAHVIVAQKRLPVSAGLKEQLLQRVQTL